MSDIIAFPHNPHRAEPPQVAAVTVDPGRMKRTGRTVKAARVASAIATTAEGSDHEPVLDVAQVVALVLRTCRRLGHKPSRLSAVIAADLERHCALGDPTAQLLRDWLVDKSPVHQAMPPALVAEAGADVAGEGGS